MPGPDQPFDDAEFAAFEAEQDRHRGAIFKLISEYADEHGLDDAGMAYMLLEMAVSVRTVAYATETEKPSVAGLRMDLDRFFKDIGEIVRESKRHADKTLQTLADILAAHESPPPDSK